MKKLILIGLVISAMTISCKGKEPSLPDGVFAYKVGQFEVFTIVEGERDGNAGILIGADEAILNRFIPEDGFKHTANAFLVKADGQNVLIDAGTGSGGVILEKIQKLGVNADQIDAVLLTHLHGDHFGGLHNEGVASFPNAKVYLNAADFDFFTQTNVNQGAVAALTPYEGNLIIFEAGQLDGTLGRILPGFSPIAAYGHTPGHTMYQIENDGEKLLVIGDLLHVALVQFAHPEISATFDVDPAAAAVIRRQVLDYTALNRIPIAGMHIVNPGIGNVSVMGSSFLFAPAR